MISSLFFADDSLFFFKATIPEAKSMCKLLKTFEMASGLDINWGESAIIFSTNTPLIDRGRVCDILQIQEASHLGKYLGVQIGIGQKKTLAFNFIRDRIWSKL